MRGILPLEKDQAGGAILIYGEIMKLKDLLDPSKTYRVKPSKRLGEGAQGEVTLIDGFRTTRVAMHSSCIIARLLPLRASI